MKYLKLCEVIFPTNYFKSLNFIVLNSKNFRLKWNKSLLFSTPKTRKWNIQFIHTSTETHPTFLPTYPCVRDRNGKPTGHARPWPGMAEDLEWIARPIFYPSIRVKDGTRPKTK